MLKTAFELFLTAAPGVLFVGIGIAVYWTARHGVPAAIAKAKAWWSKGKADFANLKGELVKLDGRVAEVEQKIKAAPPAPAAPQA